MAQTDPYRTHYGAAPAQHITTALVAVGLLLLLGLGIAAFLLASHL